MNMAYTHPWGEREKSSVVTRRRAELFFPTDLEIGCSAVSGWAVEALRHCIEAFLWVESLNTRIYWPSYPTTPGRDHAMGGSHDGRKGLFCSPAHSSRMSGAKSWG